MAPGCAPPAVLASACGKARIQKAPLIAGSGVVRLRVAQQAEHEEGMSSHSPTKTCKKTFQLKLFWRRQRHGWRNKRQYMGNHEPHEK